jgi:hypothetical protein
MAIGLNDLRKHILSDPKNEPPSVLPPQAKSALETLRNEIRDPNDRQPPMYWVRKRPESEASEMESAQQAIAAADPSAAPGAEEPAPAAPQNEASSPKGLTDALLSYVEQTGSKEYQVFQAVGKVFDQTKDPQAQLNELTAMYEPIEALGQAVATVFGPLEAFRQQLAQLARTFEPVRSFQQQVAQLAETFEAVKPLQEQLVQLTGAFQIHLAMLIKALEPAEELRMRIIQLAEAFEPATTLHERFGELLGAFDVLAPESNVERSNAETVATAAKDSPTGSAVTFFVAKSA